MGLQTHRGEVLWARHADGTPWTFALLTGSSSIGHSLRCAIAIAEELGHERPAWRRSAARLVRTVRDEPDAFAPKHRWAMDWYYPVLTGAVLGDAGRERLAHRREAFVIEAGACAACRIARGSPRPRPASARWRTWRSGSSTGPSVCSAGPSACVAEEDRYWTGIVVPEEVHFPGGEQSTYTASAIILAADALADASPAARLFIDHDALPAVVDVDADLAPESIDG